MQMTGGQAIVKTLVRHGIDTVFGLPGIQLDYVFDALYEARGQIRTIHTRHEQGAAYMAMGYAQASGKVGACLVVPGPGLLNAGAAIATAMSSNVPLLCLTGQIPSYQIGKGLGMNHELEDQDKVVRGIVRWTARAETPQAAPTLLGDAFQAMLARRPQPVVFEMAPDIMAKKADVDLVDAKMTYEKPAIDEAALMAAARLLASAERPAIFAGAGAFSASEELRQIAELLGAPVIMSRTGRGALSDRHPLAFGPVEGQALWLETDAALIVGSRFMTPGLAWGRQGEVRLVRIEIDPVQAEKPYPAEITLLADVRTALIRLIAEIGPQNRKRPSRRAEFDQVRQTIQAKLEANYPVQRAVSQVLREALGEDGILICDVTQMAYYAQLFLPVYQPRSLIIPGYQGTLGYGYPTALGAKVANPDRPVVAICGDGGFMFNVGELSTQAAYNIPLVTIVFNDGAYGNVKRYQQRAFGERYIAVDLHNPDFVRLAQNFGIAGYRAETIEELRLTLHEALAANKPALIEMPVGEVPDIWDMVQRPPSQGKIS